MRYPLKEQGLPIGSGEGSVQDSSNATHEEVRNAIQGGQAILFPRSRAEQSLSEPGPCSHPTRRRLRLSTMSCRYAVGNDRCQYESYTHPRRKKIARELKYFRRNRHRMRYAALKEQGLPIGSGVTEAACKTLATQRMKRSGMRWGEPRRRLFAGPKIPQHSVGCFPTFPQRKFSFSSTGIVRAQTVPQCC